MEVDWDEIESLLTTARLSGRLTRKRNVVNVRNTLFETFEEAPLDKDFDDVLE